MGMNLNWYPLSKDAIQQFDEEGYLIVRQALDCETVGQLTEASDRLIGSDCLENRQNRADGRYDGFRNCIVLDDAFLPLLTHQKIFPIVVQLLGAYLHLTTSHLIYKHPDPPDIPASDRSPDWHRDYGRLTQDLGHAAVPRAMLKCAYYLTDLSEPNSGATLVAPGSNLLREPLEIPEDGADPDGVLEPRLQPGDCLLFENRTWHAGAANLSDHTRKVVMFGYGYRWAAPIDYRVQPDSLLEKLDPLGRYLLGEPLVKTREYQTSGGESPLRAWCEEHGLPIVRPPVWEDDLVEAKMVNGS